MTKDVGDDGYIALANAIILQAVDDYKNAGDPTKHIDKREVETFFNSDWYEQLTSVSADYIKERIG